MRVTRRRGLLVKLDTPSSSQTRRAAGECPHRARAGERPAGGFKSGGGPRAIDVFSEVGSRALASGSRGRVHVRDKRHMCRNCDCHGSHGPRVFFAPSYWRVSDPCRVCGPTHLFSTLDLYCQPASHVSTLSQNSMARLVEVDVLEDGLGRELLELAVRVSLQIPG